MGLSDLFKLIVEDTPSVAEIDQRRLITGDEHMAGDEIEITAARQSLVDELEIVTDAVMVLYDSGWTPEFLQQMATLAAHSEEYGWTMEKLMASVRIGVEIFLEHEGDDQ